MKNETYVIPIDFTEVTLNAITYGAELAKRNEDNLVLVHVVDNESAVSGAEAKMKEIIAAQSTSTQEICDYKIVVGNVFDDMGRIAESLNASLILMATHGEKGLQKVFGSHALRIITHSSLPVLVIQKDTVFKPINKLAMTIDIEKESIQVVKAASILSEKYGAKVVLVGGKHEDTSLRAKVLALVRTSMDYLSEHQVESSVELLDRKDFEGNLIKYCKSSDVDMLAATYYPDTFHAFSQKFVQHLMENKLHIPVITIDSEAVGAKGHYSF